MTSFSNAIQVSCTSQRPSVSPKFGDHSNASLSSSFSSKPLLKELQLSSISSHAHKTVKNASIRLLDAFVDLAFEFVNQPLLPSQSNFAPVEERKKAVDVTGSVDGTIPDDSLEGVYIRNGEPEQILFS